MDVEVPLPEDLESAAQAVEAQCIDAPGTSHAAADLHHDTASKRVHLRDELMRMRDFHSSAYTTVRSSMEDIRQNGRVCMTGMASMVSRIVRSVRRNPSALLCMKVLQDAEAYTYFHSVNVATIAVVFAHFLDWDQETLREVGMAGVLHDIGKQRIPLSVLNAPRRLTPTEFELVKKHPTLGYELLRGENAISENVKLAVLQHHEKYNGTGYPLGVQGDDLSIYAPVLALADIYDALTSNRPYKRAFSQNKTAAIIYKMAGTAFEEDLVGKFIRCFGVYPVGSLVRLSNGNFGIVCENHQDDLLRPTVLVLVRSLGHFLFAGAHELDLREEKDCVIESCEDAQECKVDVQTVLNSFIRKSR